MAKASAKGRLLRLGIPLFLAWSAAWMLGLSTLAWLAVTLRAELRQVDLDAELALYATSTYGLTWFDADGTFHKELFLREGDLTSAPVDIWVLAPGAPPIVHLAPETPRFRVEGLSELASRVVAGEEEVFLDGRDARGEPFRLHAIPTFQDASDEATAMVAVVADPRPGRAAHRAFVARITVATLALGLLGLLVGIALTRWSLRPAIASLEQRERFLTAAAHELRTPIAALRGVCDSARAGDEDASRALERMAALLEATGDTVSDLLLFARLEGDAVTLRRERVRLDLLAEAVLPEAALNEDSTVRLEGPPCVADVDPGLVTVAIRNLVENARLHGGPSDDQVRVVVTAAEVVVEDRGPGFPQALLERADDGYRIAPSHRGTGLGVAISALIAALHGGQLELENRRGGGARARLRLSRRDKPVQGVS